MRQDFIKSHRWIPKISKTSIHQGNIKYQHQAEQLNFRWRPTTNKD